MANNKVLYGDRVIMDITDTTAEPSDVAAGEVFYGNDGVRKLGTGNYMNKVPTATEGNVANFDANGQVEDSGLSTQSIAKIRAYDDNGYYQVFVSQTGETSDGNVSGEFSIIGQNDGSGIEIALYNDNVYDLAQKKDIPSQATETTTGTIKLNPVESVTLNANGQLVVGGRLGQFPNGGVFYPTDIAPTNVGKSSFLMTDGAKGINLKERSFAIMAGAGITCKSTPAGSTTYRVSNTQANRFALAAVVGGRAALNQTDAATNGTAAIVSIKFANGNTLTAPTFGPTDSSNDIIITLERSINPDAATTTIRVYGTNASSDNLLAGQGVGAGGGKVISLGQSTYAGGNQNIAFGNSAYVNANNSVGMGHTLLVNKQFCFASGQGHDFTNATNGTAALGTWSDLKNNTKFAVGVGTANDTRSNIFEVTNDSGATGIVVKAPNGTKYKLSVNNSGSLSIIAV